MKIILGMATDSDELELPDNSHFKFDKNSKTIVVYDAGGDIIGIINLDALVSFWVVK